DSDQLTFLDRPFVLKGTIKITNYYNFGYNGAEQTHYSFAIEDGRDGCAAYMEHAKAGELRQRLLSARGPLKGVFTVVLLRRRYYASGGHPNGLFVELLDYRLEP